MEAKVKKTLPIRLDVLDGKGKTLHSHEFIKEKIVLGRILSADLRIDDVRVSRIHALLEVRGEELLVTDLASTHGTFVNGKKVVESRLKLGDTLRIGAIDIKLEKGSGSPTANQTPTGGAFDTEETQIHLSRENLESMDRRFGDERRDDDAFPDERRLNDRRGGERRIDQRKNDRRGDDVETGALKTDRRKSGERRVPLDYERRVGERRRGERRVFDITSLERRIDERRVRKSDDDILPEDLERAFETPSHARELEVTALWGDHILDVSNYYEPIMLSVGESPINDYIIPSVGIPEEFPFIHIEEDNTAYLSFTNEMSGTVRARDKIYTLKSLASEKFVRKGEGHYTVPLKQDDFAKISIGSINFFILYVKPAPRILPPPIFEKDPLLIKTIVSSTLLMLFLLLGTSFLPEPKPVTIEMIPERYAKIVIKKRPPIPKSGIMVKQESPLDGGSQMGEGGRAPEPEGKAGKPELKDSKETPQAIIPKNKITTQKTKAKPVDKKQADSDRAKAVGLLRAFSKNGVQKDLKDLLDKEPGFDAFGKYVKGFRGSTIEDVGGAGGKGLKGVDVGGGGKTVGIDGPSTKGYGRGYYGDGIGEGISGPGRLGMKGEHAVSIISENVQILSGLPKDVINAVVFQHRAEIRQCYEAARQRNNSLRGKVVIAFNISPNGVVTYAGIKESSVGDTGLESCMVSRVRTWNFPKPEAPVVTEVSAYPFYLNPAN